MKEKGRVENKMSFVITFDYELFMGKDSGTVLNSIIKPAGEIITILKKHKAKAIFFIDALFLLQLKHAGHPDFAIIRKQLIDIINADSSIELHIHPQWLDAYQSGSDRWNFKSLDKYRLHNLTVEKIKEIFTDCTNLLEEIAKETSPGYKIRAFRAGGWAIQPFDIIKPNFLHHNIKFDFSVNPGLFCDCRPIHYCDYRYVDQSKDHWYFEDDPCLIDEKGSFIEIPITRLNVSSLALKMSSIRHKKSPKFGDGVSVSISGNEKNKTNILKRLFARQDAALSLDSVDLSLFRRMCKRIEYQNRGLMTAVGHPKLMNDESLRVVEYIAKTYKTMNTGDLIYRFMLK